MGNFDHYAYGNNVRGAGGFTFIWWLARGGREGGKEAWGGLGTVTLAKRKAIGHLWRRLGVLVQRGNAVILRNQVPSLPDPLIDGNL